MNHYYVYFFFQLNYTHGANACNSVRVTIDVNDDWDDVYKIIDFFGQNVGGFRELARPGYFNDADEVNFF